jgi:hypothetical protein
MTSPFDGPRSARQAKEIARFCFRSSYEKWTRTDRRLVEQPRRERDRGDVARPGLLDQGIHEKSTDAATAVVPFHPDGKNRDVRVVDG